MLRSEKASLSLSNIEGLQEGMSGVTGENGAGLKNIGEQDMVWARHGIEEGTEAVLASTEVWQDGQDVSTAEGWAGRQGGFSLKKYLNCFCFHDPQTPDMSG